MNKAILVMDMPKSCSECIMERFTFDGECVFSTYDEDGNFILKCPLKESPTWLLSIKPEADEYVRGWNDCLDKIIGESDE